MRRFWRGVRDGFILSGWLSACLYIGLQSMSCPVCGTRGEVVYLSHGESLCHECWRWVIACFRRWRRLGCGDGITCAYSHSTRILASGHRSRHGSDIVSRIMTSSTACRKWNVGSGVSSRRDFRRSSHAIKSEDSHYGDAEHRMVSHCANWKLTLLALQQFAREKPRDLDVLSELRRRHRWRCSGADDDSVLECVVSAAGLVARDAPARQLYEEEWCRKNLL